MFAEELEIMALKQHLGRSNYPADDFVDLIVQPHRACLPLLPLPATASGKQEVGSCRV